MQDIDSFGEHEAGESDDMEACQDFRQALVVTDEASEAGRPGEGAFNDPAPGEQDKAALGFGGLDHLKANAVLVLDLLSDLGTGVTLIDPTEFDDLV